MNAARKTPPLSLSLQPLLLAALFIAVFAGFQGGRYYFANRLQELGIACSLLLYLTGCWRAAFCLGYAEWRRWVLSPLLLLGGIILISALVFNLQYEGKLLYSAFSAREFLLAFMGPGVYLLCRSATLSTAAVHRTLWLTLFALMLNYLFFYFTMDLRAAFFSSDHTVSNLVTYDAWRGFRLKPPLFAIMLALLASLCLLIQGRGRAAAIGALLCISLAAYIWSIVMFRSTLATMLLSVVLYPILLSRANRLKLVLTLSPLVLLMLPVVSLFAAEHFLTADGGGIRAKAFALALEHIAVHPLLGAGEDSAYGASYQDIVAHFFFPSDLGLIGITYKYGIVGLCLYLFMHGKLWLALYRANLAYRIRQGRIEPLLWGMLIFMTAQTFNLALNPGLAYAQGITVGSLALALASLILKNRIGGFAPGADQPILRAATPTSQHWTLKHG